MLHKNGPGHSEKPGKMRNNKWAAMLVLVLLPVFFPLAVCGEEDPDPVVRFFTGQVDPESVTGFIRELEGFGTRFALSPNRREVAEWIRQQFVTMGYADARLDSFQLTYTYRSVQYETWQYNVIAEHAGYMRPDSIHILGAHYDSIVVGDDYDPFTDAPGADDNASGVAAVLETARLIKKHGYEPENTLHFIAFGAEELGLHGSRFHANKAAANNQGIVMMINNDMIGYTDQMEIMWTLDVQFYPGSDWLTNLAREVATTYTSLQVVESNSSIRFTDSWPFHAAGYDAVFLHEYRFNPFYHTPEDLLKHVNPDYLAEMVKVSVGMLISRNGSGDPSLVSVPGSPLTGNASARIFSDGRSVQVWFDREESGRQMQVFDTAGRLLISQPIESGKHHKYHLALDTGIYLVRVGGSGEMVTGKVFIQSP